MFLNDGKELQPVNSSQMAYKTLDWSWEVYKSSQYPVECLIRHSTGQRGFRGKIPLNSSRLSYKTCPNPLNSWPIRSQQILFRGLLSSRLSYKIFDKLGTNWEDCFPDLNMIIYKVRFQTNKHNIKQHQHWSNKTN